MRWVTGRSPWRNYQHSNNNTIMMNGGKKPLRQTKLVSIESAVK